MSVGLKVPVEQSRQSSEALPRLWIGRTLRVIEGLVDVRAGNVLAVLEGTRCPLYAGRNLRHHIVADAGPPP